MLLGKATKHYKTIQPQQQQQQPPPPQPPSNYLPIFAFSFPFSILPHLPSWLDPKAPWRLWPLRLPSRIRCSVDVEKWFWCKALALGRFAKVMLKGKPMTGPCQIGSDDVQIFASEKSPMRNGNSWEFVKVDNQRLIRIDTFLNDWTFWTRI